MPLSNITNNTYFQSYLSTTNSNSTIGALTIVDNTNPNSQNNNLVGYSYNLFIDDTFISGGYGFSTLEEYQNGSYLVSSYNNIIQRIDNDINTIYDYLPSLSCNDDIIINQIKNSYGFTTSYNILNVKYTEDSHSYLIQTTTQTVPYIQNINIERDTETSTFTSCNINISYTPNIAEFDYTASKLHLFLNNTEVDFDNNPDTIEFSGNNDNNIKFSEDLNIQIKDINTGEVYYNEILKDYIQWKDTIYYFTGFNYDTDESYNFRNSSFSSDNIHNRFKTSFFDSNSSFEPQLINNYEFDITFNSNNINGNYDYFITTHQKYKKIEFYFNGIKINNWKDSTFTEVNDTTYYVWQSPQKYIGPRTWHIKIVN